MIRLLAALGLLVLAFMSPAEAGCPAGSNCETYRLGIQDYGINILGGYSGTTCDPTGVNDSTACIQAAIDYAFTHDINGNSVSNGDGINHIFCPHGTYKVSYPIFFDPPGNLRGGWTYSSSVTYAKGDIVTYNGTLYVSLINSNLNNTPASSPSDWSSAVQWSSGTTYAAGATVLYNGIPWASLAGSNTGNTPTTTTGNATWWQPTTSDPQRQDFSATFNGGPGLGGSDFAGSACQFNLTYNNAVGFWTGAGNGILIDSLIVKGPIVAGGPGHHCGLPTSFIAGSDGSAAIAIPGDGGGANRTKLVNVGAQNMYAGIGVGWNGVQLGLGSENKIIDPNINNTCYGIYLTSEQNYINYVIGADVCGTTGLFMNGSAVGMTVEGGNWSCEDSTEPATSFAMSSVSASFVSNQLTVTATLTLGGDTYMVNTCNSIATCVSNVYNAFTLKTTHFGVIPMQMSAFNASTGAGTWVQIPQWSSIFQNTCCGDVATEVNGLTKIYAAEMVTVLEGGGITAKNVHIENFSNPNGIVPTTLINSDGIDRANVLTDIFLDYDPSGYLYLGATPSDALLAAFYAQQVFDFITVGSTDVIISGLAEATTDEYLMVSIIPGWGRLTWHNSPQSYANPWINLRYINSNNIYTSAFAPFSLQYVSAGTAGFGAGFFDTAPNASALPLVQTGTAQMSQMLGIGWEQTPFWGNRPAPWTRPCISPSQNALLQSLPAITNSGSPPVYTVTYPILWGGQQYGICDWNLTPTAYAGGTTYSQGNLVTSGGTTYYSLINSNTGNTPVSSPSDWAPFHYGFVSAHTGWSYGQNLTTSNVPSLAWSSRYGSPVVYVADSSARVPQLFFPGMIMQLTGSGAGCTSPAPLNLIILGVHRYLGYVDVLDAAQDGSPYLPNWTGSTGTTCTGTTVGQPSYSFTNLN